LNPENPKGAAAQPASILIVDDTAANLQVLAGMLKDRGYRVRPVPSGKLALQAAGRDPPDLILLDINMPEMSGYEVCRRLRADEATRLLPVIMVTALDREAEYRSDEAAEIYLARSGMNPLALYAVLQKMIALGTESASLAQLQKTHPPLDSRMDRIDRRGYGALEPYTARD